MSPGYPNIERWLGSWLGQLASLGDEKSHRVIVDSLDDAKTNVISADNCNLLDEHLRKAATACSNLHDLFREKKKLPADLHEANMVVLNKLAEIRAVVGPYEATFTGISFSGTPDLIATLDGVTS